MNMENKWGKVSAERKQSEKISSKPMTYGKDVWLRFSRKKTALGGLVVILILIFIAIAGPSLSDKKYDSQNLAHVNTPPFFKTYRIGERYFYISTNLKLIEVSKDGRLMEAAARTKDDAVKKRMEYNIDGNDVYLNYKKTPTILENGDGEELSDKKVMHNRTYILGTDNLGRDLLIRLIYGARISLTVAFIAAFVNLIIGTLYGSISAYAGGTVDIIMMRVVDIISTIPLMLYVIMIMVVFNNTGLNSIVIALGLVYWVGMARVVRGQILSLKQQEFVLASKTMGSNIVYILANHLIPNTMGPIIVTVTMLIPSAIFIEAFMSFVGLGITAPMASWGTMCNDSLDYLRSSPYQLFFPAAAISIAMFAFNFIGDGLRDALDPRMRR